MRLGIEHDLVEIGERQARGFSRRIETGCPRLCRNGGLVGEAGFLGGDLGCLSGSEAHKLGVIGFDLASGIGCKTVNHFGKLCLGAGDQAVMLKTQRDERGARMKNRIVSDTDVREDRRSIGGAADDQGNTDGNRERRQQIERFAKHDCSFGKSRGNERIGQRPRHKRWRRE